MWRTTSISNAVAPVPVPGPCDLDGTAVTSGTIVCRGGGNFTCTDDSWGAVGTACR